MMKKLVALAVISASGLLSNAHAGNLNIPLTQLVDISMSGCENKTPSININMILTDSTIGFFEKPFPIVYNCPIGLSPILSVDRYYGNFWLGPESDGNIAGSAWLAKKGDLCTSGFSLTQKPPTLIANGLDQTLELKVCFDNQLGLAGTFHMSAPFILKTSY